MAEESKLGHASCKTRVDAPCAGFLSLRPRTIPALDSSTSSTSVSPHTPPPANDRHNTTMSTPEARLAAASTFLLQSPPGEGPYHL